MCVEKKNLNAIIYCILFRHRPSSLSSSSSEQYPFNIYLFYFFFFLLFRIVSYNTHILYYFAENMAAHGLCIDLVFLIKSIIAYYSNFEMGACEMNQE